MGLAETALPSRSKSHANGRLDMRVGSPPRHRRRIRGDCKLQATGLVPNLNRFNESSGREDATSFGALAIAINFRPYRIGDARAKNPLTEARQRNGKGRCHQQANDALESKR